MFPIFLPMFMPSFSKQPEDWEIVIDGVKYKLTRIEEEIKVETPVVSTNARVIKLRAELAELRNKLK